MNSQIMITKEFQEEKEYSFKELGIGDIFWLNDDLVMIVGYTNETSYELISLYDGIKYVDLPNPKQKVKLVKHIEIITS